MSSGEYDDLAIATKDDEIAIYNYIKSHSIDAIDDVGDENKDSIDANDAKFKEGIVMSIENEHYGFIGSEFLGILSSNAYVAIGIPFKGYFSHVGL